jgi:hypothetical protein
MAARQHQHVEFGLVTKTTTEWVVRHYSTGPHRPRWKGRILLGTFYVAPGMSLVVDHRTLSYGMQRLHLQRVRKRKDYRDWMIETWWGQRAPDKGK